MDQHTLFQEMKRQDQAIAKSWFEKVEKTGYSEIEIGSGNITININQEAKEILSFLRDEGGIEYEDPRAVYCG